MTKLKPCHWLGSLSGRLKLAFKTDRRGYSVILLFSLVVAVGLVFASITIWGDWKQHQRQTQLLQFHRVSELLSATMSQLAIERGMTEIYLSQHGLIAEAEYEQLGHIRVKVDSVFQEAQDHLTAIPMDLGDANKRLNSNYLSLDSLRGDINYALSNPESQLRIQMGATWFDAMTSLIASTETVRKQVVGYLGPDPELANVEKLRIELWQLSEFAGRERAIIGKLLSSDSEAGPDEYSTINDNWINANRSWRNAMDIISQATWQESQVPSSVLRVQSLYFKDYADYRNRILQAMQDRKRLESSEQWFERATGAVDCLVALNSVVSEHTIEVAKQARTEHVERAWQAVVISVTVLVICVIALIVFTWSWRIRYVRFKRWLRISEASDQLLRSVGELALERGVIYAALAGGMNIEAAGAGMQSLIRKVWSDRATSSERVVSALKDIRRLGVGGLSQLVRETEDSFLNAQHMRMLVDLQLQGERDAGNPDLQDEWRIAITELIDNIEEVHLVSLHAAWRHEYLRSSALQNPAALKHFIWVMSEFTGRERALIGGTIASGVMPPETMHKELHSLRRRVDSAWAIVQAELTKDTIWSEDVSRLVRDIESDRNSYQTLSGEIIDSGSHGGEYICTTHEWIKRSTDSIELIHKLSSVVGRDVTDIRSLRLVQLLSMATLGSYICMLGIAALVVQRLLMTMPAS